ncbi:MAG: porin, partial [Alistipes sp.]|nr:porin [Alistipes sp.]
MRNILILISALLLLAPRAKAQENDLRLQAETRIDYSGEHLKSDDFTAGFYGRYLNVILSGTIGDKFSYAYRQRLNKAHADQSFFDATDWLYLHSAPSSNWQLSAGKQVVAIGG